MVLHSSWFYCSTCFLLALSFTTYFHTYLLPCKPAYILSCLPICFIPTYILMYVLTSLCSYLLAYLPTYYWLMLWACLSMLTIIIVNLHTKNICRNTLNGTTHPNIKRYNSPLTNWNPLPHKSSHNKESHTNHVTNNLHKNP
jgi:hypothetical protein